MDARLRRRCATRDAVPTVKFDGELATGFAGCNYYEGDYALDADSIEIGGIASSAMACPVPEMEAEETYFSVYAEVDGWSIEDGELVPSAGGDEVSALRGRHRSVGPRG